jgi:hypothetical protein
MKAWSVSGKILRHFKIRLVKNAMDTSRKILFYFLIVLLPVFSFCQENKNSFELYGTINTDIGYNFNAIHPDWFDVMRPTKLPSYQNEFGPGGNVFFSVRQTKLGLKTNTATKLGELKTQFDFDLIGFGKDAGQTTLHVINAYAQLGRVGAGQTPSAFMDPDVFPETLDYWGPLARVFFLNVQLRYVPIENKKQRLIIALERPGGKADGGDYANSIEIQNIKPVFNLPNLTAQYRRTGEWGYIQIAGIVKSIKWKDLDTASYDLSGNAFAWGGNLSVVWKTSDYLTLKGQGVYGKGIENYIADAPADIGLQSQPANTLQPLQGKALPVWGFFSFAEITWTKKWRTAVGYSMETITNTDLQSSNAFRKGQYAVINLRYSPIYVMMIAAEYQYGRRDNFSDGFHSTGNKIQFTFKFNFSEKIMQK